MAGYLGNKKTTRGSNDVAAAGHAGVDSQGDLIDGAPLPVGFGAASGVGINPAHRHGQSQATEAKDPLDDFFITDGERSGALETYLNEALEAGTSQAGRSMLELLAFWVGGEEYAIDIVEIQEIIKVPLITAVPRVHTSVLGVISLRGTIVPVVDLRVVLKLERQPLSRATRILVLRADGDPVGLLVDKVTSVVRLDREAIEQKPRAMQRDSEELLEGVGRVGEHGERLVIVLDVPAILAMTETAA